MSHKRLFSAAGIIALVLIVSFMLSVPHASEVPGALPAAPAPASVPAVTLHDSYKKGVHTISGSLLAPDACMTATAGATLVGDASSTESILVAITMPTDTGICLELPTPMAFSASIAAPAGLPVSATVNGALASTTAS